MYLILTLRAMNREPCDGRHPPPMLESSFPSLSSAVDSSSKRLIFNEYNNNSTGNDLGFWSHDGIRCKGF